MLPHKSPSIVVEVFCEAGRLAAEFQPTPGPQEFAKIAHSMRDHLIAAETFQHHAHTFLSGALIEHPHQTEVTFMEYFVQVGEHRIKAGKRIKGVAIEEMRDESAAFEN